MYVSCIRMTIVYPPSRIVQTVYGKVQGRRLVHGGEREVDAFQGIPFAAPPIGDRRFRKPIPPTKWDDVKQTVAFGPRSIQDPMGPGDYEQNGVPSEDCLYLNVFTPCWKAPEEGFPVMVFIHGGGFVNGEASSYGDIGICENIVPRGVVFVTIQYRLGYLGFFSTGDQVCPGNFGLWDQTEALKWIQLNIGAFGGNKNNITLLGQSAGAGSVDLLHLSPHSTNLFHKAVLMAGTAECRWAINSEMLRQSIRKVGSLGLDYNTSREELFDALRTVPAQKFSTGIFSKNKEDNIDFEAGPCLDDDFFPESLDALRAKAKPKPFLTGVTKEEGLLMIPGRKSTREGLEETLNESTLDCSKKVEMKAEMITRFVRDAKPEDTAYMRAQSGMISDAYFIAGTLEHCRKTVAIQNEPVFLYVFEHFNPSIMGFMSSMMPIQDSTHTCELFYLFKKGVFADPELTEIETKALDLYTTVCTNFAKHGDPNVSDTSNSDLPTVWNPITQDNPSLNYVITVEEEPKMRTKLFEGRTTTFVEILNKYK